MMTLIKQKQQRLSNIFVFLFIILVRITQFSSQTGQNANFFYYYNYWFSFNFLSLILPTAYCIWISGSYRALKEDIIILRFNSRISAFICQEIIIFSDALLFTTFINITVLPFLISYVIKYISSIIGLFILQMLFFIVCSLIFFIIQLITNKQYIGYIAVVLYGLWDYFYSYGRVVSTFEIGTGRLLIINYSSLWVSIAMFISLILILSVIGHLIYEKNDIIAPNPKPQTPNPFSNLKKIQNQLKHF